MNKLTLKYLKYYNIPINKHLPEIDEVNIRPAKEVAIRIIILGIFLAISDDKNSIPFFKKLIYQQGLSEYLFEKEKNILHEESLTEQEEINLSWVQESIYMLSWCLEIVSEVPFPDSEIDLESIFPFLPPEVDTVTFFKEAALREEEEVISQLEIYYHLHWAKRHPKAWNSTIRSSKYKMLNISVIRERRKALEWVINSSLDWDDITLDT